MPRKKKPVHGALPELVPLLTPISELVPDPRNARAHSKRNLEAIQKSYEAHGQRKPIVVQVPGNIVRAGNGQVEAAKALGWTHLAAVFVEETDEDAMKYAIRDNRTAEMADWDIANLGGIMLELDGVMELSDLGFTQYEYEPFVTSAENWTPPGLDPAASGMQPGERRTKLSFSPAEWTALLEHVEEPVTASKVLAALNRDSA